MLSLYLWLYTLVLAIVWWFFIVAKIHSYKFKNFSTNIEKVTKVLLSFLIILSILWYVLIFSWFSSSTVSVNTKSWFDFEEVNY